MSENYTIARLTKENEHFEILVKPDKALDYRTGKTSRITEVLATEIIFADANKGTKVRGANEQSLRNNRPTENCGRNTEERHAPANHRTKTQDGRR
jgi:ribosome maturation protein Sdo1